MLGMVWCQIISFTIPSVSVPGFVTKPSGLSLRALVGSVCGEATLESEAVVRGASRAGHGIALSRNEAQRGLRHGRGGHDGRGANWGKDDGGVW